MNFDNNGSHLWAGDVGQNNWEEVDRLVSGGNYGWNEREGAHCYDPATNCATDFQEPITEYDHSIGQSITGGFVYSGIEISTLDGWYVFGDFISGTVLAIPENSVPTVTPSIIGSTNMNISSFAQDENWRTLHPRLLYGYRKQNSRGTLTPAPFLHLTIQMVMIRYSD